MYPRFRTFVNETIKRYWRKRDMAREHLQLARHRTACSRADGQPQLFKIEERPTSLIGMPDGE
jgi:hypothetical protein